MTDNNYAAAAVTVSEGEWAGWTAYPGGDPFEDLAGPFHFRVGEDGRIVCAFRPSERHMNGGGFLHGGCLMTFADFCLFVIARDAIGDTQAVTATFNSEFVGSAHAGDLLECAGEVVKAGASMIFVRGLIRCGEHPVMSFSAVLKKVRARAA